MSRCAECGKPADARFAPFCSTRCQQIDLGRWLDERYHVPYERVPLEPDELPPEANPPGGA